MKEVKFDELSFLISANGIIKEMNMLQIADLIKDKKQCTYVIKASSQLSEDVRLGQLNILALYLSDYVSGFSLDYSSITLTINKCY